MLSEAEEQRMAEAAKAEGNTAFKKQKYGAAAERYTEAIATAPRWHVPYVNRAQCYRKLAKWPQVEQDCRKALDLCSGLVKANFFLGVAYRHQLRYSEACICLDKALEAAREQNDAIKDEIWREIAACKHAWWEQESQQRADKRDRLQARLLAMMDFWDSHRAEPGDTARDRRDLNDVLRDAALRDTVTDTDNAFACPMTMEPFREPVVTQCGHSYERSALRDHLIKVWGTGLGTVGMRGVTTMSTQPEQVGHFDPVTRNPCTEDQVFPNYRLRAATRHYLDEHPWAYSECMDIPP